MDCEREGEERCLVGEFGGEGEEGGDREGGLGGWGEGGGEVCVVETVAEGEDWGSGVEFVGAS